MCALVGGEQIDALSKGTMRNAAVRIVGSTQYIILLNWMRARRFVATNFTKNSERSLLVSEMHHGTADTLTRS